MATVFDTLWPSVQHVAEATVQPCLAGGVVMPGMDRFIVDVGKVSAEAGDFLREAVLGCGHQLAIALIPQRVAVRDGSGNAPAIGLDRVFGDDFGIEWR